MSALHESRSRHHQTLSNAVHPSVAQKDENRTVPDQDYRGDGGAQSNQIWRLPPGFVTCVRHRRHFHRLLQQRYLSDDRVLTHVRNKHQCCYLSICTLLSLFWNEKKNVGRYFLSNPRRLADQIIWVQFPVRTRILPFFCGIQADFRAH